MTQNEKNRVCIENRRETSLHRAGWLIVDSATIIENGTLEIENGFIKGVHKSSKGQKAIDHGPGILMPPLVNTHLHLELSALKNSLPFDQGFKAWVKLLLEKRDSLGEKKLIKEAQKAVQGLIKSGNLFVGDISSLDIVKPIVEDSGLNGVCFDEFLGSGMPKFFARKNDPVSFSVAGHGPHTTSPELLRKLKNYSRSLFLPFSIHAAESDDESEFIREKKGGWADFLSSRGIDWSKWDIGAKTPVAYLDDLGLLDPLTLAVHLLNIDDQDMEILARTKTGVCVCPRSNHNLHQKLPDIEKMIKKGIKPALGTDSLASCDSLNIFDEMAFVKDNYPGLDPEIIFSMGTVYGARALGLEDLTGTLTKGKKAQFLYRSINIKNKRDIFLGVTSSE